MSSPVHRRLVRRSDPLTSLEAASEASEGFANIRPAVLAVLREEGPLTLDELVRKYKMGVPWRKWPQAADSSIRTRCAELVDQGLVERVPNRVGESRFGRRAALWRAKEATR